MSDLELIALRNVPYRLPGREKFWIGLIDKGQRVPADHPAAERFPDFFRPATAADLRGSVHVGFLEDNVNEET